MFWFFLSVFIIVDAVMFNKGFNSLFWKYETDDEKKAQKIKLGLEKKP